jgi:hypothetical protein
VLAIAAGIAAAKAYLRHDETKPVEVTRPPPIKAEPPASTQPERRAEQPPKVALPSPPPTPSLPPPTAEAPTSAPTEVALARHQEQPEQREPPASEANAAPAARDPWQEPVPRALQSIEHRVSRGVRMSQRALVPAYEFAHQYPRDPRPWLLLGRAYAQLDWLSDSVERYLRAYRIDPTCRRDPQMLPDLLKAATHPVAGRSAARAIRDIYGAEAIPAVDQELKRRESDREAAARLARLRESLSR